MNEYLNIDKKESVIDKNIAEESLDVIKLNLQGGFVKLQHELELTITPYMIINIREKQVSDLRKTKDKYADIVNNSDLHRISQLFSHNSDAGKIQKKRWYDV